MGNGSPTAQHRAVATYRSRNPATPDAFLRRIGDALAPLVDFVDLDESDPGRRRRYSERLACPNEHDISIDALLQRESAEGEKSTDVIILTHDTVEGRMRAAIAQMQALNTVLAPIVSIRKEELN